MLAIETELGVFKKDEKETRRKNNLSVILSTNIHWRPTRFQILVLGHKYEQIRWGFCSDESYSQSTGEQRY